MLPLLTYSNEVIWKIKASSILSDFREIQTCELEQDQPAEHNLPG